MLYTTSANEACITYRKARGDDWIARCTDDTGEVRAALQSVSHLCDVFPFGTIVLDAMSFCDALHGILFGMGASRAQIEQVTVELFHRRRAHTVPVHRHQQDEHGGTDARRQTAADHKYNKKENYSRFFFLIKSVKEHPTSDEHPQQDD